MAKARTKFAWIGALLTVVLVVVAGFTLWFAYHSSQVANTALKSANKVSHDVPHSPIAASFATCKKAADSTLLQTYPEQCVTKSGKTFTDTSQGYLVITEWGVQIPLNKTDLHDAQYTLDASGNTAHISTKTLAKEVAAISGCKSGLDDVYLSRSATKPTAYQSSWGPLKLGGYYYAQTRPIEPACATQLPPDGSTMHTIQQDLVSALPNLVVAK